jgi:chitinase
MARKILPFANQPAMRRRSLRLEALATLGFLILTALEARSEFKVIGYFPSWQGSVSNIQFDRLTAVNYAFLLPTSTGGLQPIENASKLQSLVSAAHAKNVKVFIAVGGWNNGDDSAFETLSANSASRTTFVNNLIAFVNQYSLDGVDIDWEYPDPGSSANNYAALMQALSNALHGQGKQLSSAVVGAGSLADSIPSSVFGYVDNLNLMAYDANNFQHSTYAYAVQSLDYWLGRGLPAGKAILGVPFYGRPSWESFAALVARGADPFQDTFDGVGYNGITTIKSKTHLALDRGGGIMMWELSQDATGSNSLLTSIDQEIPTDPTAPLPFEAESLTRTGTGATTKLETDASASGGQWISLLADGTGDYIEYTLPNIPAGTYQLKLLYKAYTNRGILGLAVDGTTLGGALDQYASTATFTEVKFGVVTFASTGNHIVRLTVTGINPASTIYTLSADKFTLVPSAANTAPTITNIADQSVGVNTATGALSFTVGDGETSAGLLVLSKASTNTTLVPLNGIVFGGSGANRTVTITPAANQLGTATVTVSVGDGALTASDTFNVAVTATPSQSWRLQYFGTPDNTGNAADLADPDKDGCANLTEFALNSDPTKANSWPINVACEGTDLTLTYTRRKAALSELTFTCLWANAAVGPWDSSGVTQQVLSDNGTHQQIKARVLINGSAQKFLRLQIVRP